MLAGIVNRDILPERVPVEAEEFLAWCRESKRVERTADAAGSAAEHWADGRGRDADVVMRIAVSGAHRTGKTTLIGELVDSLPSFSTVDEPYHLLAEEGHLFAELPGLEDFELQLERSIVSIVESEADCLFDRCPADLMAYLIAHDESAGFDIDRWLPRVRDAMRRLDLVVFVPIEEPDRVPVTASDHRLLRQRVDEELREIVLDDRWGFAVPAIEVTGSPAERARRVLAYLGGDAEPRCKTARR